KGTGPFKFPLGYQTVRNSVERRSDESNLEWEHHCRVERHRGGRGQSLLSARFGARELSRAEHDDDRLSVERNGELLHAARGRQGKPGRSLVLRRPEGRRASDSRKSCVLERRRNRRIGGRRLAVTSTSRPET